MHTDMQFSNRIYSIKYSCPTTAYYAVVECHLHKGGGQLGKGKRRILRLRGVSLYVHDESTGPRTEHWGTPQEKVCKVVIAYNTKGAR